MIRLFLVLAAAKALEGIYGVSCPLAALAVYGLGEAIPARWRERVADAAAAAGGAVAAYIAAGYAVGWSTEVAARILPVPVAVFVAVVAAAVGDAEREELPGLASEARRRLRRLRSRLRRLRSLLTGAIRGPRRSPVRRVG